jgi:hypothetical protein
MTTAVPQHNDYTPGSISKYTLFCVECYKDAIDRLTLTGFIIPGAGKKPAQIVPRLDPDTTAIVRARARQIIEERAASAASETSRHPQHAGTR